VKQVSVEVTHQGSNISHFGYLDPIFNSRQPNSMPPPSSSQIHPPFPTLRQDFTYLGPILMREHAQVHPNAHLHVHAKPRQSDVYAFNVCQILVFEECT